MKVTDLMAIMDQVYATEVDTDGGCEVKIAQILLESLTPEAAMSLCRATHDTEGLEDKYRNDAHYVAEELWSRYHPVGAQMQTIWNEMTSSNSLEHRAGLEAHWKAMDEAFYVEWETLRWQNRGLDVEAARIAAALGNRA